VPPSALGQESWPRLGSVARVMSPSVTQRQDSLLCAMLNHGYDRPASLRCPCVGTPGGIQLCLIREECGRHHPDRATTVCNLQVSFASEEATPALWRIVQGSQSRASAMTCEVRDMCCAEARNNVQVIAAGRIRTSPLYGKHTSITGSLTRVWKGPHSCSSVSPPLSHGVGWPIAAQ
jgi:hypothetical protein